jgi:hypothetical protein
MYVNEHDINSIGTEGEGAWGFHIVLVGVCS